MYIYILWGPIICGPDPFIHWSSRPEPRKVIAQDRWYKYKIVLGHSRGRFSPRHVRGLTGRKGKNGIGTVWKKSKISRSIEKDTLESITTRESCHYCHSILCTWQSHTLHLLQPPPTTLDMGWWDKYQSWKSRSYTWTKDKEHMGV